LASGIWTSVSGAAAREHSVETVANNLANVDTVGFKKDAPVFKEYISTLERENDRAPAKTGRLTDQDLKPVNDKDQSHVVIQGTYTSFKQGPIRVTQNPLDLALEGPGLLEVNTPNGMRFTRNGALKLSQDGRLVTSEGYAVMAASENPDPASRFINLRDRPNLSITRAGEIYSGEDLVGKLSVKEFPNQQLLKKVGGQFFENKDAEKNVGVLASNTNIHQGMVEGSNVNPIEEMSSLIRAHRLYESDLKTLKTFGEMMGKENEIGH
jgi:flagellar basal-body rod protein FlgF